jgi:replication factor A2
MQVLPSHAVKANTSIHEMQGQLPHAVKTNAPAYVPFSSGVRDQVHSAQVNQG